MTSALRIFGICILVAVTFSIGACGESSTTGEVTSADVEFLQKSADGVFYPFDEPPVLTDLVTPEYPQEATREHIEGTVMVKIVVRADGSVENAAVLNSSHPVFEVPAVNAALQCQFKPAQLNGKPTKSQVAIPYQFKLNS
jgi:TonB family protein